MGFDLLSAFNSNDLQKYSSLTDIVSLNLGKNAKTGERFAKAVLDNGTTLIKSVTSAGVEKMLNMLYQLLRLLRNEITLLKIYLRSRD